MNRIVLIGNGFDLAHGLKTSYADFISWYWEKWGERLLHGSNKKESDGLCSFTLNDSIDVGCWSYVWGFYYKRQNPYIPWNTLEVIKLAKEDKDLCRFKYNGHFLEKICQSFSTKRWVDIENDYYSLLERRIAPINSYSNKDVEFLNLQMDVLRVRLIDYLKQEQEKGAEIINEIKDKIYGPIKKQEISVTFKNIPVNDSIGGIVPSTCMLLNFNYTQTPEQYISEQSNVFINYIHGKIDTPKSIIFGYGDELNENYKKLQDLNENECLRHIKSIRYLESDNYRRLLEFIESDLFQIIIMGHSCGNTDRTLLNTLFEHKNCISIKPYYHIEDGKDNYLDLVMNISRNFTDMKLMRNIVVNKTNCEPLSQKTQ